MGRLVLGGGGEEGRGKQNQIPSHKSRQSCDVCVCVYLFVRQRANKSFFLEKAKTNQGDKAIAAFLHEVFWYFEN